ncbi:CU044_2847 family protein [Haliangium sp.]|uniref:CU044_2847 family protein n=1 Tax=Haliangium sp. TaxID=2663208 RepID=UPI003D143BD8
MPVEVKTKSGQTFFVETEAVSAPARGPSGDAVLLPDGQAMGVGDDLHPTMFDKAVGILQSVAQDVSDGLEGIDPRPTEVEMSVDIGFDASGNVWIFKGGTKASLRLVLRWKQPPQG